MGEERVYFLRETIVSCELTSAKLRSVFHDYESDYHWRLLQLQKTVYLATGWTEHIVVDSEIESDVIADFVIASDTEIQKVCRVAAVLCGVAFSVSALPRRAAWLLDRSGSLNLLSVEAYLNSHGPEVILQFAPRAVSVLARRPEGVRMFFDAECANSEARRVSEYFRLLEAAFGLKGGRLEQHLLPFLASGNFSIDSLTWTRLKSLRDRLNHAYRVGEIAFDGDAVEDVRALHVIAADVLAHKLNWGTKDTARSAENFIATCLGLDGTVHATQGFSLEMKMQLLDPVSGIPLHLAADKYNKNYRRLADRFRSSFAVHQPA